MIASGIKPDATAQHGSIHSQNPHPSEPKICALHSHCTETAFRDTNDWVRQPSIASNVPSVHAANMHQTETSGSKQETCSEPTDVIQNQEPRHTFTLLRSLLDQFCKTTRGRAFPENTHGNDHAAEAADNRCGLESLPEHSKISHIEVSDLDRLGRVLNMLYRLRDTRAICRVARVLRWPLLLDHRTHPPSNNV
ncbi:MAG: hypothetical protein AAGF47_08520 [Planctomycetota bacterium]